jgi:hypothetical protein
MHLGEVMMQPKDVSDNTESEVILATSCGDPKDFETSRL